MFASASVCKCKHKHVNTCLCFQAVTQQYFISSKVGWTYTVTAQIRGREESGRGASQWSGRMNRKTCAGSHCVSNVITGSDSSMWHTILLICQSEIGRVTNGYHCYFSQPPPPPSHFSVCIFFETQAEGGESDLNLGGCPNVGGHL